MLWIKFALVLLCNFYQEQNAAAHVQYQMDKTPIVTFIYTSVYRKNLSKFSWSCGKSAIHNPDSGFGEHPNVLR